MTTLPALIPPSPPGPAPGGRDSRAALRRMRLIATGILVLMIALLIAARLGEPTWPALGYVRAFAEAATVGACADWFAVTALFRRPLGLPIPHTAIIPRHKDRIAAGLGSFIETNFLSPELVEQKLVSLAIADRASHWLAEPTNAARLADRVAGAIPSALRAVDDAQVGRFVEVVLLDQLRGVAVAPLAGRVLSVLIANNHHEALIDAMLDGAAGFVDRHRELLRERIARKSSWWIPRFLDEKIFQALITGIQSSLLDMRAPDNRWRQAFEAALVTLSERLQTDPAMIARGERVKDELLESALMRDYLGSVWTETRRRVLADLDAPESLTRSWLAELLVTMGRRIRDDAAQRAQLDRWIVQAALSQIVPHRRELGEFIASVVRRWDARTFVDKLESAVGPDLQYIRISGAVVGGLVGLALYELQRLLG